MSHIVTIKTEVRDAIAVHAACRRLGLAEPVEGTFTLFGGEATGLGVQLPDWQYPVVCHLDTGQIEFDNFGGRWGDQRELGRLMQSYACERAKLEARKRGHQVVETPLPDGSVKLIIQVSGGAV